MTELMTFKDMMEMLIESGWMNVLMPFFESKEFEGIMKQIGRKSLEGTVYPLQEDTFNAFKYCSWDNLKVVIIGKCPYGNDYLGKPIADGLAFSSEIKDFDHLPHSLQNIINEIEQDIYDGHNKSTFYEEDNYDLMHWAKQGVLLLNQSLTTGRNQFSGHVTIWKPFFNFVMMALRENKTAIVYMPFTSDGDIIEQIYTKTNHLIKCPNPDPIFKNEFLGSGVFTKCNNILKKHGIDEIKW